MAIPSLRPLKPRKQASFKK